MVVLSVLCGIQCSGKSTYVKNIEQYCNVISSDAIRKEFPDYDNEKVFKLVYQRMNESLQNGKDVVLDATNITIKARKQIFANLKVKCRKECIIFNTPIEECRERLKKRNKDKNSHYVPPEVLEKYYHSFQIPFYEEGWDFIDVINKPDAKKAVKYCEDLIKQAETFDQNNKHHTQLLGQHMETVYKYLTEHTTNESVITAGSYHDVGKLFTQTYKEGDPNAHYYDHANVGTYELMCNSGCYDVMRNDKSVRLNFIYDTKSTLEWLFYINYHMILHNVMTEKSQNKWKQLFGEEKYNNLKLFMEADFYRPETV